MLRGQWCEDSTPSRAFSESRLRFAPVWRRFPPSQPHLVLPGQRTGRPESVRQQNAPAARAGARQSIPNFPSGIQTAPLALRRVPLDSCASGLSRLAQRCGAAAIQLVIALRRLSSQGLRSSSFRAIPCRIFSTLEGGWKSSASANSQPSCSARRRPTVVLPAPTTPITITIMSEDCNGSTGPRRRQG